MRVFWLATHPTMPATYSMQYKLRVPDSALVLARSDIKRQADHEASIAALVAQKHTEKLMADVHCLFATKPGLRAQNVTTIDEVDAFYPGAHATLKRYPQDRPRRASRACPRPAVHAPVRQYRGDGHGRYAPYGPVAVPEWAHRVGGAQLRG